MCSGHCNTSLHPECTVSNLNICLKALASYLSLHDQGVMVLIKSLDLLCTIAGKHYRYKHTEQIHRVICECQNFLFSLESQPLVFLAFSMV